MDKTWYIKIELKENKVYITYNFGNNTKPFVTVYTNLIKALRHIPEDIENPLFNEHFVKFTKYVNEPLVGS